MAKTVVITQSNYLPWRGYFDLLRSADEVVLLDCVQYTTSDWRNRNRIKTAGGIRWLTVPTKRTGHLRAIDETFVADPDWAERHIRAIDTAYRDAIHYHSVAPWLFTQMRSSASEGLLTKINERLIRAICNHLGIDVSIHRCSDIVDRDSLRMMEPTPRLIALLLALGTSRYLSGPRARAYLDAGLFAREGIELAWMRYDGYPEYPQLWGTFEPNVSIIDLLFNTGLEARQYLERH